MVISHNPRLLELKARGFRAWSQISSRGALDQKLDTLHGTQRTSGGLCSPRSDSSSRGLWGSPRLSGPFSCMEKACSMRDRTRSSHQVGALIYHRTRRQSRDHDAPEQPKLGFRRHDEFISKIFDPISGIFASETGSKFDVCKFESSRGSQPVPSLERVSVLSENLRDFRRLPARSSVSSAKISGPLDAHRQF